MKNEVKLTKNQINEVLGLLDKRKKEKKASVPDKRQQFRDELKNYRTNYKPQYNTNGRTTNDDEYVYEERDKNGWVIYSENENGSWTKYKRDNKGRIIYEEDSDGDWGKTQYNNKGNKIYYEDSTRYWEKWEYDKNGKQVSFKSSDNNESLNEKTMKNELNVTREQFNLIKTIINENKLDEVLGLLDKSKKHKPTNVYRTGVSEPETVNDFNHFQNIKGGAKWIGSKSDFENTISKYGQIKIYTGKNGIKIATDGSGTYFDESDRPLTKKQAERILNMYID